MYVLVPALNLRVTKKTLASDPAVGTMTSPRLLSIDYFRGLAVLLMLIYDYVPFFTKDVPLFLQHGRPDMLLFGDFVAPFFLFIMGMSLAISVSRQRGKGVPESKIFWGVLRRAALLFAFGLIIDNIRAPLFGSSFGFAMRWGILETLGASYLVTYLVMCMKPSFRIAIITISLALHMFLLMNYPPYVAYITTYAHGSPASVLSWGAIAAFGMIAGEHLSRAKSNNEKYLYWLGGILIVVGTIIGLVDPPRKELVTSSYALITAGGASIVFMLIYFFIETRKVEWIIFHLKPLKEFGVAALSAWVLQYAVASYFIWYYNVHEKLSQVYGLTLATAMIAVVWVLVTAANRRHLALKF